MLATLSQLPLSAGDWVFEHKYDGERVEAVRNGSKVDLVSRSGRSLTGTYPELVQALLRQPTERFVIDGEVVALDDHGVPSFERLQGRFGLSDPSPAQRAVAVVYYVFDLLQLDDRDVTSLPLRDRKQLLRKALHFRKPLRFSDHESGDPQQLLAAACAERYEGVMAKRADRPYAVGKRTNDWLKLKCKQGQEMVIGGWTDPRRTRVGLGALLLGYYADGEFVYAGKVGTGFGTAVLRSLEEQLRTLERSTSPFDRGDPPHRGTHWAEPKLVCEVEFSEWTRSGQLRQPRFKGLRDDKDPKAVVREDPRPSAA